jgi:signal transduction histidine kinase
MLSSIKARWELRPASEIKTQGTVLRISNLRTVWNERMFRRLSTRLSRLQSPFTSRHGFAIRIETDEFPEYSGDLKSAFLDKAPYSMELDFDGRDTFKVKIAGKQTELPLPVGAGQLTCGPVRVRLYAFDLETEAIARIGPRTEVRAWLREWSGVSVYRDGFRIWPYGEPHDDWLRLDQRRVNNPAVCLSNNQVVGFVEIGRDRNPDLADQTNREGLINNQAFQDLRRIIDQAFQRLEAERQQIRRPVKRIGAGADVSPRGGFVADELERLMPLVDRRVAGQLRRIAGEARAVSERQDLDRKRATQGYADLAAAGEAAIGIGGVVGTLFDRLRSQLSAVALPLAMRVDVNSLRGTLDALGAQVAMLAELGTPGSHNRRTMDVVAEVEAFRELILPLLVTRHVSMLVTSEGDQLVRVDMNPHSFRRVMYIIVQNSLDWLIRTRSPRIGIHVRAVGTSCEVTFSDNGPGIPKEKAERVFEPMFTTKEGARGMGLTIARNLIEQHGGSIRVLTDGRRRGTRVRLVLPRKRSRATVHSHH